MRLVLRCESTKRRRVWDERAFRPEDHPPSILAIGDSWFWYPFPGGSLLNQLGRLVARKEHNILAIGQNGAEAFDYVHGKYEKAVRNALRLHGESTLAVFISGGGNDFAGFNDLRPLLRKNCADAVDAQGCFNPTPGGELYRLMEKIADSYSMLIGRIVLAAHPQVRVFVHNYDYAIPDGRGVFGNKSTWLKAALDDARVPLPLQRQCIAHVLDAFTEKLEDIVALNRGRVVLVDGRNTLGPEHWANELHPTPAGFARLARERWLPALTAAGLAA